MVQRLSGPGPAASGVSRLAGVLLPGMHTPTLPQLSAIVAGGMDASALAAACAAAGVLDFPVLGTLGPMDLSARILELSKVRCGCTAQAHCVLMVARAHPPTLRMCAGLGCWAGCWARVVCSVAACSPEPAPLGHNIIMLLMDGLVAARHPGWRNGQGVDA